MPGEAVLAQTPVYPPFLSTTASAGMQRIDAKLQWESDGHYEVDWEGFVRLNFACSRAILEDALGRLKLELDAQ